MDAIVGQRHFLLRPVAVPARVAVRPQQRCVGGVQQPELRPPRPRGFRILLHLRHVHLQAVAVQPRFVAPERPLAHAVAALVPLPVLKVRRREGAQEDEAPEISGSGEVVEDPEGQPEGSPVAVVQGEVGDVGVEAVVAAD